MEGTNYNHYLKPNAESEYSIYTNKKLEEEIKNVYVKTNGGIKIDKEEMVGIRPSIVIDKEVLYATGNGTIDNPYVIY